MFRHTYITLRALPALLAFGAAACSQQDTTGRQPLGAAVGDVSGPPAGTTGTPLPLAATAALDAGNAAYRAKRFDDALTKYREAAAAAPAHAAPWFGLYMVANEMKNSALADSAMRNVKALSADPEALDAHAEIVSPAAAQGAGALPPGHPTTQSTPPGHPSTKPLPPGHPATPGGVRKGADSTRRGSA